MRWHSLLAAGGALGMSLGLAGCLGVTDKHSTLVKEVQVNLVFKSTPTPSSSATPGVGGATPATTPVLSAPSPPASPAVGVPGVGATARATPGSAAGSAAPVPASPAAGAAGP